MKRQGSKDATVTMRDVAETSGFSPATVSIVLNAVVASPLITAVAAAVPPLYGTCASVIPALAAKRAMAMCCGLPGSK